MFSGIKYILFELIFIIGFPVVLLISFPELLVFRHIIMVLALFYIVFISHRLSLKFKPCQITFPSLGLLFQKSLLPSLPASALILLINRLYPDLLFSPDKIINFMGLPYFAPLILYPLFSVPLQEVIFRWFYVGRLSKSRLSRFWIILLAALVFGLVHLPFGKPLFALGTFLLGLWWNRLYLSTDNLWYSLISHAIVGNTLIYLALYP